MNTLPSFVKETSQLMNRITDFLNTPTPTDSTSRLFYAAVRHELLKQSIELVGKAKQLQERSAS